MKVFLCFAFEKGELQRGHLSPDKESCELFAKRKGEALIIGVTDKRCCRVSSCPPLRPVPAASPAAPGKPGVAPALLSLPPCRPQLLPRPPPSAVRGAGWCHGGPAWLRVVGPGRWTSAAWVGLHRCCSQGDSVGGSPLCPQCVPSADALLNGWELRAGRSKAPLAPRPCPSAPVGRDKTVLETRRGEIWCLSRLGASLIPVAAQLAPAACRAGSWGLPGIRRARSQGTGGWKGPFFIPASLCVSVTPWACPSPWSPCRGLVPSTLCGVAGTGHPWGWGWWGLCAGDRR